MSWSELEWAGLSRTASQLLHPGHEPPIPRGCPTDMKILLVADLHYTLRQWDWLLSVGGRFDLVVVAGDLLDIASIVPLHAQVVVVRKYLDRLAAAGPLLVCSGNHDLVENRSGTRDATWLADCSGPNLHVDGESHRVDGHFFSILPWWESEADREQTEAMLSRHEEQLDGDRWVWIDHPPPTGSPTAWTGRSDAGDKVTRAWIERFGPDLILAGHIHNAPFYADGSWIDLVGNTWVINGGRQLGGVPTFTVIDTAIRQASWVALGDAEQVTLTPPLVRRPLEGGP